MKIDKNCVVTFSYEMTIINEDGIRIQQVEKSKPLTVLFGRGKLLEPFEKGLYGLTDNDSFDFILESKNTYGPHKPGAVQSFDKKEMLEGIGLNEDDIEPGIYLPMETKDGVPFNGQIMEISEDKIVLDFNHPLAGKDLNFKGSIGEVRAATEDEMKTGDFTTAGNQKTCSR